MPFLEVSDLTPYMPGLDPAKAQEMINDASALATMYAPCIADPAFTQLSAVKAILRGVIWRWLESGSGAYSTVNVGQVSLGNDTRQERRAMFSNRDIAELQSFCAKSSSSMTLSLAGP